MADAVVTPFVIKFVVENAAFDVASVQVSFGANGINQANVVIATGRPTDGIRDPVFTGFDRGSRARIFVENAEITNTSDIASLTLLTSPDYTLFDGLIDDFGPANLSYGSFAIQVRIVGQLAWLASGTLQSSTIVPKTYLDMRVPWMYAQGADDPEQISVGTGVVDFWDALSDAMIKIATNTTVPEDSISQEILNTFGTESNTQAADILSTIVGSLVWRNPGDPNFDYTSFATGVIDNINTQFAREWFYESFFNRVTLIGQRLMFSIIEQGQGIKVVPYTPFFRRVDAYPIFPTTWDSFQWIPGRYRNVRGCLLTDGVGREVLDNGGGEVVGRYARPSTVSSDGQVYVSQAPEILGTVSDALAIYRANNGGPRTIFGAMADYGDLMAKNMTWEMNYGWRQCSVSCPMLRTDIGPLTAVRVDYPTIEEISSALETPAVYGSVQQVNIALDATKQLARTTYNIGFVRSYSQQRFEIDPDITAGENPFWNTNYIGGRLDNMQDRTISDAALGGGSFVNG